MDARRILGLSATRMSDRAHLNRDIFFTLDIRDSQRM